VFPEAEVFSLDCADYAYRSSLPRALVAKACQAQILSIDYTNFKDSIGDPEYQDAAMGAWFAMYRYQGRTRKKISPEQFTAIRKKYANKGCDD
jgi:hypothetical protein